MLSNEILFPKIVARQAANRGDHPFMVQAETGRRTTYEEMLRIQNRVGHALHAAGVRKGHTVLSMMPNVMESVHLWFGCNVIGAVETAINTAYRGNMLTHVVNDAKAELAFADVQYLDRLVEQADTFVTLKRVILMRASEDQVAEARARLPFAVESWEEFLAGHPDTECTPAPLSFRDPTCLLYTSGTTGPSKGVLCSYAQEYETALAAPPPAEADDVVYSTFPPYHVGQKLYVLKTLVAGATIVFRSAFSVTHYWSDIRRYGCTYSPLLGTMATFIYRQPERPDDADNPLRVVMMIPVLPEVADFRRRFGVKVYSFFNMTEICPVTVLNDDEIVEHRSAGRLRPGFSARIVDDDDHEVPDGQVGELVLRPDEPWRFMLAYWGRPEATVEAWRNLWFHTGDLFRKDKDGYYHFVDRKKDAIRRRGENISSLEVEAEINAHPKVLENAVVGVPSEFMEEDVKAVVVLRPGETMSGAELIEFLRPRLPYFMIPRYVEFVPELPKTPTAKVLKSVLREAGVTPNTWDREVAGIKIKRDG